MQNVRAKHSTKHFNADEHTYINFIALIANFQIAIDAIFVDVRDTCHVWHTFIGSWRSHTTWGEEEELIE